MTNLATYLKVQDQPTTADMPAPAIALAIGAHPDDIEFGCGGTLAKWSRDDCKIHYLILTDGSKGTWDEHRDAGELADTRRLEAIEAARTISPSSEVHFLGRIDGELESTPKERSEVAYLIRQIKPEAILGHDPFKRYRLHPDHRNAGWITCDSIVAARDPLFFPEHNLPRHRPKALLLWEADEPDHFESIGDYLDSKVTALLQHRSQYETTLGITGEVSDAAMSQLADTVARQAEAVSLRWKKKEAGEEFKLITDL